MTSDYIPLNEAIDRLPKRNGKRIHVQTVIRWIKRGCKGVKLSARKVGWTWFTTQEWLDEFQNDCWARSMGFVERTPAQRRKDHARAKRELIRRFGFHDHSKDKEAAAPEGREGEVSDLRPAS